MKTFIYFTSSEMTILDKLLQKDKNDDFAELKNEKGIARIHKKTPKLSSNSAGNDGKKLPTRTRFYFSIGTDPDIWALRHVSVELRDIFINELCS